MPSFKDYYVEHGKIAPLLTIGFSYLMALYASIEKRDGKFMVNVPGREIELKDDLPYLEYFAAKKEIKAFMSDVNIWGEDLTAYANFYEQVMANIEKIKKGICLI